jgi:hypothetical protein
MGYNDRGEIIQDQPSNQDNSGCYIATACYGDYSAPQVMVFRKFRDETLLSSKMGQYFVKYYYKYSPFWAKKLQHHTFINKFVRFVFLEPLHTILKK